MATGTFYLRPSADISLGHPVVPETLGAGYLAINEETSDITATYIGFTALTGTPVSYTSKFAMSIADQPKINRVTSIKIGGYGIASVPDSDGSSAWIIVAIYVANTLITTIKQQSIRASDGAHNYVDQDDNSISSELTPTWYSGTNNYDYTGLISAINESLASGVFPAIAVEITNSTDNSSTDTKNGGAQSYVSQIYLELECEYVSGLNIHRKVSGAWIQAQAAYQKQSGAWVEITEDECKDIIQKSFCIK